jgi:hypothetical protein
MAESLIPLSAIALAQIWGRCSSSGAPSSSRHHQKLSSKSSRGPILPVVAIVPARPRVACRRNHVNRDILSPPAPCSGRPGCGFGSLRDRQNRRFNPAVPINRTYLAPEPTPKRRPTRPDAATGQLPINRTYLAPSHRRGPDSPRRLSTTMNRTYLGDHTHVHHDKPDIPRSCPSVHHDKPDILHPDHSFTTIHRTYLRIMHAIDPICPLTISQP